MRTSLLCLVVFGIAGAGPGVSAQAIGPPQSVGKVWTLEDAWSPRLHSIRLWKPRAPN
jgi:hypothetical protein